MPRTEEYIKMLRFTLTQPHTPSRGGAKTSLEELAMCFGLDIFLHPMGALSKGLLYRYIVLCYTVCSRNSKLGVNGYGADLEP